jgi:hypothetical protein
MPTCLPVFLQKKGRDSNGLLNSLNSQYCTWKVFFGLSRLGWGRASLTGVKSVLQTHVLSCRIQNVGSMKKRPPIVAM